jgi:phosphoribosylglycinamide formyltransferase-1
MSDPKNIRPRFVILISGQGSNMQAIVQACQTGACAAEVVAVIASRAQTAGLTWAAEQGIRTIGLAHKAFDSRESFDAALAESIDQFEPHYVLLAGFMRVLTPGFVERYAGRLVNIHPSLLPAFPGLHTHAQAIATGVQSHGCTVHFVTPVLDHGPIIAQGVVPVLHDDTPETLALRVLDMEHHIYPQVAGWLAQGRVHLTSDQRVQVDGITTRLFTPGHYL